MSSLFLYIWDVQNVNFKIFSILLYLSFNLHRYLHRYIYNNDTRVSFNRFCLKRCKSELLICTIKWHAYIFFSPCSICNSISERCLRYRYELTSQRGLPLLITKMRILTYPRALHATLQNKSSTRYFFFSRWHCP